MKYLGIISVVVVVLVALLLAASPRLFCQTTLGMWVPAHQLQMPITPGEDTYNPIYRFRAAQLQMPITPGEDTYNPIYRFRAARCLY